MAYKVPLKLGVNLFLIPNLNGFCCKGCIFFTIDAATFMTAKASDSQC